VSTPAPDCPAAVAEYAEQAVAYVERAVGARLEYDSETLPLLDHYLRQVPSDKPTSIALVAATAGAYFGEVVRRHIGGRWEAAGADPLTWRVILPTALSITPASVALAAITREDDDASEIVVPEVLRERIEATLGAMGEVTEEQYYSLCGRLDTLEHLHEVVATMAADRLAQRAAEGDVDPD
jgi:hypothetical protein